MTKQEALVNITQIYLRHVLGKAAPTYDEITVAAIDCNELVAATEEELEGAIAELCMVPAITKS